MPNPNPPSLLDAARAAVGKIECQRTPPSTDPECACPGCVAYRALRAAIAREEARNGPDCIICVGGQTLPDGAVADDDELPICTDCHDAAVERARGTK